MIPTNFQRYFLFSGLILLALFPIGCWVGLQPLAIWPLTLCHLAFLGLANFEGLREISKKVQDKYSSAFLLIVVIAFLTIVSMCALPVTARDALIHHLAVPKMWLEAGAISTVAWLDVSFYPMLIQLAFAPLLQFFPPEVCAFYLALYLIPTAAAVSQLTEALLGDAQHNDSAAIAFLLTLTCPIFARLASEPLVDLPLAAFSALAVTLLIQRNMLGAVALGLALGTKPNALPFAALIVLVGPLLKIDLKFLFKFGVVTALVAAPWFIRNYSVTGNPFYPLGATATGLGSLQTRTLIYGESWISLMATPLTMLFNGADNDPRRFDGVLSPLLLLAGFGFWKFRKNRSVAVIAVVSAVYFILAQLNSGARIRYLAPIIPYCIALTAIALSRIPLRVRLALIFAHLCFFEIYLLQRSKEISLVRYLTTNETREEYLAAALPEYKFVNVIKDSVPNSACVYTVLTGNRSFYLPFKSRSAGYLSGTELKKWLETDTVNKELKNIGCEYLLINSQLFDKLNENQTDERYTTRLAKGLTRIASDERFVLFKTDRYQH